MKQVEKLLKYDESEQVFNKINGPIESSVIFSFIMLTILLILEIQKSPTWMPVSVSLISERKLRLKFLLNNLFVIINILRNHDRIQ